MYVLKFVCEKLRELLKTFHVYDFNNLIFKLLKKLKGIESFYTHSNFLNLSHTQTNFNTYI